jgi:flagellar motor switch/type III secretory pathway protein FliN
MAAPAIARLPGEIAAVPVSLPAEAEEQSDARWKPVLGLRCDLTVDLPIPKFQIGDLLKLRQGSVINAHWRVGQDVPLCLNGTRIGWIEFEIISGHLAVRLTELA